MDLEEDVPSHEPTPEDRRDELSTRLRPKRKKKLDRMLPIELLGISGTCRNEDDSITGQASEEELEGVLEGRRISPNQTRFQPFFVSPESVAGRDRLAKITPQLELFVRALFGFERIPS